MLVRRAAGCLLALLVIPLGMATAVTGYFVEERLFAGRWGGALGWGAAMFVLGLVSLSLAGFAQQLFRKDGAKDPPSQQRDV